MFKLLSPSAPWYRHVEGSPGILCTIPKKLCFLRFTLFTNILVHFPNLHTKIAKRMRCRKVMICINRPPTLQASPIPKEYGPKRWRSWIERTEICWYLTVAELTDTLKTSILWEETRDKARTLRRDLETCWHPPGWAVECRLTEDYPPESITPTTQSRVDFQHLILRATETLHLKFIWDPVSKLIMHFY